MKSMTWMAAVFSLQLTLVIGVFVFLKSIVYMVFCVCLMLWR